MNMTGRQALGILAAATLLSGCMKDEGVTRFLSAPFGPAAEAPREVAPASLIIAALQARQSALVEGSAYAQVAASVMAADSRVAEAELRVARLRAEAAQKNWLPTLSPRVSLTSLGDFAADLLINQVLFDNGRKQAERDLAKADVELAAVALTEDGNTRIFEALTLYLQAEEGREAQKHYSVALQDMTRFEWVMNERVRGGVSDPSDLNVLRQKLASIRAKADAAGEKTVTALAELGAMSAGPLSDLRGLGGLGPAPGGTPLAVLRAMAERDRALAEARIARAGHLPGLGATVTVDGDGASGGANVLTDQGIGFGTPAALDAIEAGKVAAERRVDEAREEAQRKLQSEQRQLEALRRQAAEARGLSIQARQNLDLFQRQYEGGQRQVMDVVGVYETYSAALERELELKYKAARAELTIARLQGALAEGQQI
ncbi:TolC family protein [Aestuariicoccus sp. MJ-SS9]|uniref:TolC family protein n=1 Tax=Aestuariicoccus sp. MJ-SS9 TaxID=3079855 RepID=UPI0029099F93|nr:TolC family protein [Aestuariicoccus sp. MJ-SS9]MDU8909838.1 TolC family protein [Aestuariicoccus sp. MJ-SS9]